MRYPLFISCPRDMEYLLNDELTLLGFSVTKVTPMGVYGDADQKTLYQLCLWSRIANRVQLILTGGKVENEKSIYQIANDYDWRDVFSCDKTLAIEFHGESQFINNTMYGAQLVKDGVVDFFRQHGDRPSVDKENPDIRLHAFLKGDEFTLSLDLAGYSLHQRGYRQLAGGAPIKENVAAAILIRAGWESLAKEGQSCIDPFCGSGTFIIEAALMATNTAPGLLRDDHALENWIAHDEMLWQSVRQEAGQQQRPIENKLIGFDNDDRVIEIARNNAVLAGVSEWVQFETRAIEDFKLDSAPGLVVTNPPYGERISDVLTLVPVYQALGRALYHYCQNSQAVILTASAVLAQSIGLRSHKQYNFYNGPLKVKLYCFNVDDTNQLRIADSRDGSSGMHVLFNRLNKNKKHLAKWLKRSQTSCYRLYDADIPEYAFAVDIYNDWVHVQEYAPPKTILPHKAEKRVLEMMQILPEILEIAPEHVVLKQRIKQKGKAQYNPLDKQRRQFAVQEGDAKFLVNLYDYLDTGLFLDHRLLRLKLRNELNGKQFLNCFCYTASVSVQAALGGAITTNIDLSRTYLDWAKQNFAYNNIPLGGHQFFQADCLEWLLQCTDQFDVIFLDPPSFSNSKRMDATFDVQRDHEKLIQDAMKLLAAGGILYFSNNLKKFKLAPAMMKSYRVKDITPQTIDEDFKRSKDIHHCFRIEKIDVCT